MKYQIKQANSLDLLKKAAAKGKTWDCIITDPVYEDQPDMDLLLSVCKGHLVVFCAPEKRPSKTPDEVLFWVKPISTKNTTKSCSRFVEEILVYRQGKTFNPGHWSTMTGIFNDTLIGKPIHPWEKPISMIEKLVSIYSNPGDLVLDPFSGSGTTAVACRRQGRKFEGYEINPEYVKIANDRLRTKT